MRIIFQTSKEDFGKSWEKGVNALIKYEFQDRITWKKRKRKR